MPVTLTVLDVEVGMLISALTLMGIRAARCLQLASPFWHEIVALRLDTLGEQLPRKSPFSCIGDGDLTLLWANIGGQWTKLRSGNGDTLLHAAATSRTCGILPFVACLPGASSMANTRNSLGKAAIHLCAARGLGLQALLALPGLDLELRDNYGASALLVAVREQRLEAVQFLLQQRADVNTFAMYAGPRLATPLAAAVSMGDKGLVRLLLSAPGICIMQPLLLGVPGAPTAREFARTESMRSLLTGAMTANDYAQAVDPDVCMSIGLGPSTDHSIGAGIGYIPDLGADVGVSLTGDVASEAGKPLRLPRDKQAIWMGCWGEGRRSILRQCVVRVCGDRVTS